VAKKIKSCRVCGSKALSPIFIQSENTFSLFEKRTAPPGNPEKFVLCDPTLDAKACGLVQREALNIETQFPEIPSNTFRINRDHLRAAATEALELISGRDCSALDIGCNDGTLLSYFPRWVDRFGVDSDPSIETIGEWAWTAQCEFPSTDIDKAFGTKTFDIITCISTFETINDPSLLLDAVKERLVNDGVFVLETLYAPMLMANNNIEALTSNITALYSLGVIEQLVREKGLKIFRGALTNKEGGSIRLFITHDDVTEYDFDPWSERLARLWDEETVLALRDRAPYQAFTNRSQDVYLGFQAMLERIEKRAESIYILGTDQQAEILLNWAGPFKKLITHAVEISPSQRQANNQSGFQNHNLRVITESECRAMEPDYLLVPAKLKREMLEYWRESIQAGGKIIFMSPEPHIVDSSNYTSEYGKTLSAGDSPAGVETLRGILHAVGGPRLISNNDEITAKSA